jgi:hypothetical protein
MSQDADGGSTDVVTDPGSGDSTDNTDTFPADTSDTANTTGASNADDTAATSNGDDSAETSDTSDTSTADTSDTTDTTDASSGDDSAETSDTSDTSTADTSDTPDTTDASSGDDSADTSDTVATPTNNASAANGDDPSVKVDFKKMVAIPSGINSGVSAASQATMLSALGVPGTPQDSCGTPSPALQKLMKTASVGPFRVTGLVPAVDALTRVFAAVKSARPDLYALLGTAGMLCVRHVRGSTTNFSNHSWGTAIDITIGGQLTPRGSTTVQQGLVDLAPFMHAERFFWGAAFPTPDGMHFEASNELIADWKSNKTIP